ncbi:nitroreductase family protein [Collinsella sp. LCP19S3_C6]|uniref:nitroreductase family protein n=1 Tax=unclassified Collinsella TaxID=2637548 RepID=UPI003F8CE5D5
MDVNTIKVRKRVRTFSDRPIPSEVMARLEDFARHDTNPFGVPITFKFLDHKRDGVSSPVIVGANTYVAAKYHRQEDAELGFGYSFEKFVLLATSMGLGTVWLAATIDRKAFERALEYRRSLGLAAWARRYGKAVPPPSRHFLVNINTRISQPRGDGRLLRSAGTG